MDRFYEQTMGVYFDDLDAFGILHNARYLLLFERCLGSFWQHIGLGSFDIEGADHHHLVAANRMEYKQPVRGVGKVRVRLWIERVGRSSMTIGFKLMPMDQDVECASGERVVVCVDPEQHKPRPWSEGFRDLVAPWVKR